MKVSIITFRTAKTLGDVMGAYRSIQALCRGLLTKMKVNFFIYGSTDELAGLHNMDGTGILSAPNENVNFEMHLFNTQQADKSIDWRFKAKVFFLNLVFNVLAFLNNRVTSSFAIGKCTNFLNNKLRNSETEYSKKIIMNMFSEKSEKCMKLSKEIIDSDLMVIYASPGLLLALLHLYSEPVVSNKLPKKLWFISEYNGADAVYQSYLQQVRDYPKPHTVDLKIMMTGFPDPTAPESTIGVFADQEEPKELTQNENDLLENLGYGSVNSKTRKAIFFGYTNYSNDIDGEATCNPRINLDFFVDTAIKQYVAFHPNILEDGAEIDVIAPFTVVQARRIASQQRNKHPNMSVEAIFAVKKDNNITLQKKYKSDEQKRNGSVFVRLINVFPLSPNLFKYFLKEDINGHSIQPLTIQTGDQSFIEAILNKKVPLLYQIMSWKMNYYLKFLEFLSSSKKKEESLSSNLQDMVVQLQVIAWLKANLNFMDTKAALQSAWLDVIASPSSNIEKGLTKLTAIATNPESFKHVTELFQILSDKIVQDLNAADKLRKALRESFPTLEYQDQEMRFGSKEPDIEMKFSREIAPEQEQFYTTEQKGNPILLLSEKSEITERDPGGTVLLSDNRGARLRYKPSPLNGT